MRKERNDEMNEIFDKEEWASRKQQDREAAYGIIISNRAIPLDNFVRFVYNESTSKGGLTYVHYRN